jgi:predicted TIM-barrel fold metal-dependent hydrolase
MDPPPCVSGAAASIDEKTRRCVAVGGRRRGRVGGQGRQPKEADTTDNAGAALAPPQMIVDTHAHVFTRALRPAADARYRPACDATVGQYLDQLDAHGVAFGVLVQPSFLAPDNAYLLTALARAPQRLRGVAVIDAPCPVAHLGRLHVGGVRGIRFNPFRRAPAQLRSAAWRAVLDRVAELGWHVVVHEEGAALVELMTQLRDFAGPLLIDHLGRPGTDAASNDRVEAAVLERAASAPLFVKLSAPYRTDAAAMRRAARRYLELLGPRRLLWGSDWPWPNFEGRHDYAAMLAWLDEAIVEPAARAALHAAAARLYGFAAD